MVFKQLHHFAYDCKQDSKIATFSLLIFALALFMLCIQLVFLRLAGPVFLQALTYLSGEYQKYINSKLFVFYWLRIMFPAVSGSDGYTTVAWRLAIESQQEVICEFYPFRLFMLYQRFIVDIVRSAAV